MKFAVAVYPPDDAITLIVLRPGFAFDAALTVSCVEPDAVKNCAPSPAVTEPTTAVESVTEPLNPGANCTLTGAERVPPGNVEPRLLPPDSVKGAGDRYCKGRAGGESRGGSVKADRAGLRARRNRSDEAGAGGIRRDRGARRRHREAGNAAGHGDTMTAPVNPALRTTGTVICIVCPAKAVADPLVSEKGAASAMLLCVVTARLPPCATPENDSPKLLPDALAGIVTLNVVEFPVTMLDGGSNVAPPLDDGVITTGVVNPEARVKFTVTLVVPPGKLEPLVADIVKPGTIATDTGTDCVSPAAVPVKVSVPPAVAVTM